MSSPWDVVCITLDVDWATEDVLASVLERLRDAGVKATFFATHQSDVLAAAAAEEQFEVGLHPNFNDCGGEFEQPIADVKGSYPNATGARSHSLFVSSHILELYMRHGLNYESNIFLLAQAGLQPVLRFDGLVSLPFNWSDDKHFELGRPFEAEAVGLDRPGLTVLNFHPIHVYMNTVDLDHYGSYRAVQRDPEARRRFVNTERAGVSTLFDEVLGEISRLGLRTRLMGEVAAEFLAAPGSA